MNQTQKGNNWHFGMKAHIGVDAESGLVHTVTTTAANDHDITQPHALVHGEEEAVFGDSGYIGVEKREDTKHIKAAWYVAMKPSQRHEIKNKGMSKTVEKIKASFRAKVERQFRVIKCQFWFRKVRYKGLAKNTAQIFTLFALIHIWMMRYKFRSA